jgi:protein xylosyltransferase
LYEAFSDFPNVYFPTWRIATIWGGASLLQMLLRSLEDLEYILTNWKWDYFINLSESDYPLRTNGELVNFLKAHNGDNFVKTHGADIKKFVQKQGLDRTFVECDNHMWRVDNRKLPGDITVDGGSDWIAIHRNYSRYLVTDRSRFLTGLKRYYEFSLLPAESFFHTVLRNGPMCETFVKTNLRVTNWNRKLGCRCQYKHIVDWCGCSPNDFLSKDLGRLQSPGDHHFFARKFEAIVNMDVINRLDSHLYGSYPGGSPALSHFWENVYHVEDDVNYPYNARYSTYQSFLRQALSRLDADSKTVAAVSESCAVPQPAVVKEVTVLMVDEAFKGLIVTLREESSTSLSPPEFEVLFTPVDYLKKYTTTDDIAKRVYRFEVGSDWDGKESIFRNYGGILGAWDNPVAAVRLIAGRVGDVTIVWEDPTGARVSSQSVKVESGWFVTFHKPKLERPIRPGVWNSRVELTDGTTIMERKFLVVPLTHENMNTMEDPTSVNAARENDEVLKDSSPIKVQEWKENVRKTGKDLEQWLDELVGEFWKIESVCRTGVSRDGCSYVSECASTDWSTFSPDPKSELGQVKWDGRIR